MVFHKGQKVRVAHPSTDESWEEYMNGLVGSLGLITDPDSQVNDPDSLIEVSLEDKGTFRYLRIASRFSSRPMRLADVLAVCTVRTVSVAPQLSLADAVLKMHAADAVAVIVQDIDLHQGILTADDILRTLTSAGELNLIWNRPVSAALTKDQLTLSLEEKTARVIEKMTAASIDYLAVIVGGTTQVISLCRLLQAENANLHGEVQHLQTYIDALHDAPND
jgi:CBS domain-containing protein